MSPHPGLGDERIHLDYELAAIAHAHGVPLHTDAAQATGKIPIDVDEVGVDLLTSPGTRCTRPKASPPSTQRPGRAVEPIIYGGGQEHGLRAGTETSPTPSRAARPPTSPTPPLTPNQTG